MDYYSKGTLLRIERGDTLNELGICNTNQVVSSDGRLFTSTEGGDYSRLGSCIGRNTQLKRLYVELRGIRLSITDSGFFEGIKQNSSIDKFKLNGFSTVLPDGTGVGEVGCELLKAFQENNSHLTSLEIWSCDIGSREMHEISSTLSSCTNLKKLYFAYNNMRANQFLLMVDAIRGHNISEINLSGSRIGNVGCEALATLLEDASCCIQTLNLSDNSIGIHGLNTLSNSLANNSKLKRLHLYDNQFDKSSAEDAFADLLCNTTSINATHFSNHTLSKLSVGYDEEESNGIQLCHLLHLNMCSNKKCIAMIKILKYHHIDMEELFEWGSEDERNLLALPYVVSWFDRAGGAIKRLRPYSEYPDQRDLSVKKLSAMYQFAQVMPLLFALTSQNEFNGKKRKRVD